MEMPKIVVGVDGSPASITALRWAAREAQRRGVELEVVLAYNSRLPGAPHRTSPHPLKEAVDFASSLMDAAVAEARTVAPHVRVHGAATLGAAAPTLLDAARNALLLVVGSRGGGGFASLLAGSVSIRVAAEACSPVAVVRGDPDNDTGPLVVGVDGSDSADLAVGIAFAEASRRGCAVKAVRAYHEPTMPVPAGPPIDYDPAWLHAELRAEVIEQVSGWRDKYPDVPVEYVVDPGSPAGVLAAASEQAQLVVVGTRGHHSATGCLLMGSVGLQLLHHARCPVLIARARPGA
ncbi:universal stress protein [Planosporangium thailandense]|uniref:Universal stress protein n=1 Tax=Planosporangium thailandense TaxID=765197 RepID=A0ABX0Y4U9_9ACTN|nr:universal stress protein [Planosporangium thailandense]NJC72334.1 universal stress protein [Planosporangium thailandense]